MTGRTTDYADLARHLCARIRDSWKHVDCPDDPDVCMPRPVWDMVIHLNDTEQWTRERIADWLDGLGLDLTVQPEPVRAVVGRFKPMTLIVEASTPPPPSWPSPLVEALEASAEALEAQMKAMEAFAKKAVEAATTFAVGIPAHITVGTATNHESQEDR